MKRCKKLISLALALCMLTAMAAPAALAVDAGEERVVIGADLTEDQILTVYAQFGLLRGSVTELTVTNAEERTYLEGIVSDSVIGTRSISCVYIKILEEDAGLTVTTNNISWCTEDMYRSAMTTAGIYDAEVMVGAPYSVSGTAALTGIYKAYEDITGEELEEEAKSAAADELVVTAELADELEDEEAAVAIVNDVKMIVDETEDMTDEELQEEIETIADDYGYTLDQDLLDKIIELVRSLEQLDVSQLQEKVQALQETLATAEEYAQEALTFGQKIVQFFQKIIDAFTSIFGGGDDEEEPEPTEDVTDTETATDTDEAADEVETETATETEAESEAEVEAETEAVTEVETETEATAGEDAAEVVG
ncbi:MAG: DUF1002 domain-containing protein [Oscillospiraceae bacterium]|nr:DUF1002 domain-containing protein [Oscillospiraceae bacterium]